MHRTLLLADDSVVVQKIAGLAFAKRDVKLVIAQAGGDVLQKAREVRPDLILASTTLPGTSGYQLCEAVKREFRHTAFVLLASPSEEIDRPRALRVGSDDALRKPFDTRTLNDCVERLLGPPSMRPPLADGQAERDADTSSQRSFPGGADPTVEVLGPTAATQTPASDPTAPDPALHERDRGQPHTDPLGHLEPRSAQPNRRDGVRLKISDASTACEARAPDSPESSAHEEVHRALEAAARDAFGDLFEAIVADVVDRVEKIAWEVIPEMTETLLAEKLAARPDPDRPLGATAPEKT